AHGAARALGCPRRREPRGRRQGVPALHDSARPPLRPRLLPRPRRNPAEAVRLPHPAERARPPTGTLTPDERERASLRRAASAIPAPPLPAADPERLVRRELRARDVGGRGRLVLVAVGKAAVPMARAAERVLGSRLEG